LPPNDPITGNGNRLRRATDGSRKSGARALFFAVIALGASAGAAVLITRYVDSQRVTTPTAKVVVAAKDLPLGTTIRPEHLSVVDWPEHAKPPQATTDPASVVGRVLLGKLVSGEPMLESKLAPKDARGGLAALIPTSMRAVAVRVDDVVGVAGFIHPEDRVDVVVTMRPTKPADSEPTSKVILQNVKVLAVGKELEVTEGNRGRATPVTVATLLVDPEQAEKLALAANQGQILLTLRNWSDDDAISTTGMIPSVLLSDVGPVIPKDAPKPGTARRRREHEPTPAAAAPPPPPPVEKPKEVVEILRGDRFEQRKFDSKDEKEQK
jgi:pilus assembly protein CpaB